MPLMVQQPQENAITTTLIGTSRMLTVPSLSAHLKCQTPPLESRPMSAAAVKGGMKKEWSVRQHLLLTLDQQSM